MISTSPGGHAKNGTFLVGSSNSPIGHSVKSHCELLVCQISTRVPIAVQHWIQGEAACSPRLAQPTLGMAGVPESKVNTGLTHDEDCD